VRLLRRILGNLLFSAGTVFTAAIFTVSGMIADRMYRPRTIEFDPYACIPRPEFVRGRLTIPYTSQYAAAEVASYDDEVEAFLHFQFLRGRVAADGVPVLLAAAPSRSGLVYRILVVGQGDLLTDLPRLGRLEGRRLIQRSEMVVRNEREFSQYEYQSHIFELAETVPAKQTLESLQPAQLKLALADFLLFKSQTDIRVLQDLDPRPKPLTRAQAEQSATDILAVARFYDLPLDYFLGVGAMENDYMDVNGDLTHTVWKHRAENGDIVVHKGRHRVLVSDYSVGPWQITRETIRAAHVLFLRDKVRDYTLLPERLRPPRELDLNAASGPVLTTYAGLLLRGLLDHFHGDVQQAIGAYNGGTLTPNENYASAVKNIAEYARRVLEHAPHPEVEEPAKIEVTDPIPTKATATGESLWPIVDP
jgi:hypothetical protein